MTKHKLTLSEQIEVEQYVRTVEPAIYHLCATHGIVEMPEELKYSDSEVCPRCEAN